MIKNIIILVLMLAVAGLAWMTIPSGQSGTLAGIERISQKALEVQTKVEEFVAPRMQQEEPAETAADLPVSPPQTDKGKAEPAAPQRGEDVIAKVQPRQEGAKSEVPASPISQREETRAVVPEAVHGHAGESARPATVEASAEKASPRVARTINLRSKDAQGGKLSHGELNDILSILRAAKDTLRKAIVIGTPERRVQPVTPDSVGSERKFQPLPSDADDGVPIKKKSDDGPSEQG